MLTDFSTLSDMHLPNEEARRVAREIREHWPALRLVRLEPGHPDFDPRRPFALVDLEPRTLHQVLRVMPESLLNQRLLAELIDQDVRAYGGTTPSRYWALEMAEKKLRDRKREEEREASNDLVLAIMGSNKHTFQYHDGESGDTIRVRR